MTRKYRKEHDLMGLEAEDLVDDFDGVAPADVKSFVYPDDRELERVGVRGIYLGNFIRWDTKAQHEQMIPLYDYETAEQTRTFDTYNDVDCFNYSDVHDYTKLVKHGYAKATDHAVRELRFGRLTREEAGELAGRYATEPPRNLGLFLEWIGMTPSGFDLLMDLHRNERFWKCGADRQWEYVPGTDEADEKTSQQREEARLPRRGDCRFPLTQSKRPNFLDRKYILTGKGYPAP